jgi:hypothetical protein
LKGAKDGGRGNGPVCRTFHPFARRARAPTAPRVLPCIGLVSAQPLGACADAERGAAQWRNVRAADSRAEGGARNPPSRRSSCTRWGRAQPVHPVRGSPSPQHCAKGGACAGRARGRAARRRSRSPSAERARGVRDRDEPWLVEGGARAAGAPRSGFDVTTASCARGSECGGVVVSANNCDKRPPLGPAPRALHQ